MRLLGYGYYFDPLYFTLLIPCLVIMLIAQAKVKGNFSKYSKIRNSRGLTGAQAAEQLLHNAGIYDVQILPVAGNLTDHYDPRNKTISLSQDVYGSDSIAAVGVACHEAGHAVQHATGYAPLTLRNSIIPLCNYGPMIGVVLMLIGYLLNFMGLTWLGILLFSFTFIFQFITLPVEFNASRRALETIRSCNLLSEQELPGARKVLSAAAMTYVAAMLQSFVTLLYYIIRFTGNRNSRR